MKLLLPFVLTAFLVFGCTKKDETGPMLHFKVRLSATQDRLGNDGSPTQVGPGNAAQTPTANLVSVSYIELMSDSRTQLGNGAVLYKGAETTAGGGTAIDFSQAKMGKDGDVLISIPLKNLPAGVYTYVRSAVTYQNMGLTFNLLNVPSAGILPGEKGVLAAFPGYNTYLTQYLINRTQDVVNGNRKQGYWAFETTLRSAFASYDRVVKGQSPAGRTTVVNPLNSTSPIPSGSDVITGNFDAPLTITGKETSDVTISLSFSINNSFEWQDTRANGQWDIDILGQTVEPVVDMGFRGLRVAVEN